VRIRDGLDQVVRVVAAPTVRVDVGEGPAAADQADDQIAEAQVP
jgi:hypothetical protein